jgi:GNAT superfamily N-acetyltransferase
MIVRGAEVADFAAVAEISAAFGHGLVDTGRDPGYLHHILAYGRLDVAVRAAGQVIGFAAALPVGAAVMLSDLFVLPDSQSAGIGAALLDSVLGGSPERMTFASHDHRAIALYTRAGMTARWALVYLAGDPTGLSRRAPRTSSVDAETAADWERRWTGLDRTPTYQHWSARGGLPFLVGDPAAPVAVAARNDPHVLAHICVAPYAPPDEAILDTVAAAAAPVRLYLPSVHPALQRLLRHGFAIEDFDLFMATDRADPTGATGAYEPGLH